MGAMNYYGYGLGGSMGYFLLLIPAILLSLWAQVKVKSTYAKYAGVRNTRGITGAQAARAILDANGLNHVQIVQIAGTLTDHYDPRSETISLSGDIYSGTSVSAVGIAAHEVGHAIQHNRNYVPVKLRSALVPVVNLSSGISWIMILAGLFINSMSGNDFGYYIAVAGVLLFSLATVFQLVTLPVELNASRRAREQVNVLFMPDECEKTGIKKVLSAAALTYVAALFVSVVNLLRVISMVNRGSRR